MSDSGFFSRKDFSFADTFTDIRSVYSSAAGHTEVYSARKALKRFALKALKPEFRKDPFYIGMLRKEFEIGFRLEHPFIVRTYSFEEVEGLGPCIVFEWVDGETMSSQIENHTLDEKTWRKAVMELCDALEYLEKRQIVHRDLKPSNVMLSSDGHHVKLIDFGFADSPEYGTLKVSGGTIGYSAPEQISDSNITSAADIYALGKIMETLPIKKNRRYRTLISRMTSEHSGARPQGAGEIKAELNKAPGGRWRNKYVILLGVAVCVVGAVVWIVPEKPEELSPAPTNNGNEEIKEQSLDSLVQEHPAPGGVEQKIISSSSPVESVEPTLEKTQPPVAGDAKREVHWMVILTAQETRGKARKLRESGDSLWELHTRKEVGEWVDRQTDSSPELREDCHKEITRIIELVKRGG